MAQRKKSFRLLPMHIIMLVPAVIIVVGLLIKMFSIAAGDPQMNNPNNPEQTTSGESTAATTEPLPQVTATATLGVQGDLLMHKPIFKSGTVVYKGDGKYDFTPVFTYMDGYTDKVDYMAANLETTFGGDGFPYQGNPSFNCPDSLLDALVGAGYDLLLTANNHSNDTLMGGIERTLTQTRAKGLDTLGTRLDGEERYIVEDINGIKIGMVCYTYAAEIRKGKPSLNFNTPVEKPEQINYFCASQMDAFYQQAQEVITAMENAGAEATVFYMHWGDEYELTQNQTQSAIAQKLCDMGVDVIIGGHPHVMQPMELLTSSSDESHKTVCIYSLGNAVSNQRRELMELKTGHTEDGALFTVSFEKYSDGNVYISGVDVLPTWVNLYSGTGGNVYNILPLDKTTREEWKTLYSLTEAQYTNAKDSYDRTMEVVGEGLETVQKWISDAKAARQS